MTCVRLTHGILGTAGDRDGVHGRFCRKGDYGIVLWGPYEDRPAGQYRVTFPISFTAEPLTMGDPVCVTVEVVTNQGRTLIAEKLFLLSDLESTPSCALDFDLLEPRTLEYRVRSSGQVDLFFASDIEVVGLGPVRRYPLPRASRERMWANEREFLDGYLRNVGGLIHVGANLAQERRYYWLIGLDVLWVEAIPSLYTRVIDNISKYPRQRAVSALLKDRDGEEVEFKIANNNGASSSILPLEDHATLWPGIEYVETQKIMSTTLDTLMERQGISTKDYQALTLDVEGAELMVLQGAGKVLSGFEYVKCEVADFPARTGTPGVADLDAVLTAAGFAQLMRRSFALGPGNVGTYWDVVWKRVRADEPLHEPGYKLPLVMNPLEVDGIEKCE